jgi:hypothetical protein
MTDTFLLPWEASGRRLAQGHLDRDGAAVAVPGWPLTRASGPSGGAVLTLDDHLRWARYCLDGSHEGAPPVTEATRVLMQQPTVAARSSVTGVGLGWLLQDRGGCRLVTHGGNVSNLHLSTFVMAPDLGAAVVVLSNGRGGLEAGRALVDAALASFGITPPAPPTPCALEGDALGRYDAGAWQQRLSRDGDRLLLQMELPPEVPAVTRELFTRPPTEVLAVEGDRLVTADRPWEVVGDLGRGADGRISWLRWGMRVLPRIEGQP